MPGDIVNVQLRVRERDAQQLVDSIKPQLEQLGMVVGRLTSTDDTTERHVSLGLRMRLTEELKELVWNINKEVMGLKFKTAGKMNVVTPMDIRSRRSAISLLSNTTIEVLKEIQIQLHKTTGNAGNKLPPLHITHGNMPIKPASLSELMQLRQLFPTIDEHLKTFGLDLSKALADTVARFNPEQYECTLELPEEETIYQPEEQLRIAATLWAQYLPGVQKTSILKNLHEVSNTNLPVLEVTLLLKMMADRDVTSEQVFQFIVHLMQGIARSPHERSFDDNNQPRKQLGHAGTFDPPLVVDEAVEAAGIEDSSFGMFPFKSVMQIFDNGHIQYNDRWLCTNPFETHYNDKLISTPLEHYDDEVVFTVGKNAPFMILSGLRYKLFEISFLPDEKFYDGYSDDPWEFTPSKEQHSSDESKIYFALPLSQFKGTESELMRLSNEEFRLIMKDERKFRNFINGYVSHQFHKNDVLNKNFDQIGILGSRKLEGENYYERTTGVVRVLPVLKKGTVDIEHDHAKTVNLHDFIILSQEGTKILGYLTTSGPKLNGRLCDDSGKILGDENFFRDEYKSLLFYKPGPEKPLPSYREVANSWHLHSKFYKHSSFFASNEEAKAAEEQMLEQQCLKTR